jgi:hypothetical protein
MKLELTNATTIFYSENTYASFPDIIQLPDGVLVCVYREAEAHHPVSSAIILARSCDHGETWNRQVFAKASFEEHGYVFNCPRINKVGNKYIIVCDTKTTQKESTSQWAMLSWHSLDCQRWSSPHDLNISGMVPDKIIKVHKCLIMGYHFIENYPNGKSTLVQMIAISRDEGDTWRDRVTVAVSDKHSFCEGSIVHINDNEVFCYLRDNKSSVTRAYLTISHDFGFNWTTPQAIAIHAHRIVAGVKKNEPYAGAIIGTYRNTARRAIELFVQNSRYLRLQSFVIASEQKNFLFDFGYTGWVEFDDGSIGIVYYISHGEVNPRICFVRAAIKT